MQFSEVCGAQQELIRNWLWMIQQRFALSGWSCFFFDQIRWRNSSWVAVRGRHRGNDDHSIAAATGEHATEGHDDVTVTSRCYGDAWHVHGVVIIHWTRRVGTAWQLASAPHAPTVVSRTAVTRRWRRRPRHCTHTATTGDDTHLPHRYSACCRTRCSPTCPVNALLFPEFRDFGRFAQIAGNWSLASHPHRPMQQSFNLSLYCHTLRLTFSHAFLGPFP